MTLLISYNYEVHLFYRRFAILIHEPRFPGNHWMIFVTFYLSANVNVYCKKYRLSPTEQTNPGINRACSNTNKMTRSNFTRLLAFLISAFVRTIFFSFFFFFPQHRFQLRFYFKKMNCKDDYVHFAIMALCTFFFRSTHPSNCPISRTRA